MKTIILDGKAFPINGDRLSILEVLEKNGVAAPYQCRQGFCGVCRYRIVSGKFCYKRQPLAMAQENEIFICIAQALDSIVLDSI